MAKKIFDCGSHPYQIHSAAILSELRTFFSSNESNSIEFWEYPSKLRWRFHRDADKDSKAFSVTPSYQTKISWDFCKKSDCDELIKLWKMTFQAVRCSSHQGGSPQNGLGDEWTCGTTLASAYVLYCLSAVWSQLQMKERKCYKTRVWTDFRVRVSGQE